MKPELEKNILDFANIYDKWSFDFFKKEFVFFTAWVITEEYDGLSISFKKKAGIKANISDFFKFFLSHKECRKNFTWECCCPHEFRKFKDMEDA